MTDDTLPGEESLMVEFKSARECLGDERLSDLRLAKAACGCPRWLAF